MDMNKQEPPDHLCKKNSSNSSSSKTLGTEADIPVGRSYFTEITWLIHRHRLYKRKHKTRPYECKKSYKSVLVGARFVEKKKKKAQAG